MNSYLISEDTGEVGKTRSECFGFFHLLLHHFSNGLTIKSAYSHNETQTRAHLSNDLEVQKSQNLHLVPAWSSADGGWLYQMLLLPIQVIQRKGFGTVIIGQGRTYCCQRINCNLWLNIACLNNVITVGVLIIVLTSDP